MLNASAIQIIVYWDIPKREALRSELEHSCNLYWCPDNQLGAEHLIRKSPSRWRDKFVIYTVHATHWDEVRWGGVLVLKLLWFVLQVASTVHVSLVRDLFYCTQSTECGFEFIDTCKGPTGKGWLSITGCADSSHNDFFFEKLYNLCESNIHLSACINTLTKLFIYAIIISPRVKLMHRKLSTIYLLTFRRWWINSVSFVLNW